MLQKGRSQRGENEMKYEKTTLMAGIAALSLFAGSGLASACLGGRQAEHARVHA